MTTVFISPRSTYMASKDARRSLEAGGLDVVESPAGADWAIAYHQDELDGLVGVVPEVVFHTYEPFYTPDLPLDSTLGGTRVRSFSPWTAGLHDTWLHWLRHGPRDFVDPAVGKRSGTAILASVKQFRHAVVAEDLTAVRYDLAARAHARGEIDVYGQGWGDIAVVEDSRHPTEGSFADVKHAALAGYAVNVCLESAHVQGFVTEKLWQAIRAGCLPVYYGSSWLDAILPPGAYVDLRDFEGVDAVLDHVNGLRRRVVVERVRTLQDQLRAIEERTRDERRPRDRWVDSVVEHIRYRADIAARAASGLGTGAPSILDLVEAKFDGFAADTAKAAEAQRAGEPPTAVERASRAGRAVHVSDEIPYLREAPRRAAWSRRGYTVVESPDEADWAVAYHQRELPALVGRVPRIVLHTYEPLFTRSLPLYSRIDGSEIYSFSPWTAGVNDAWRYWLRFGSADHLDPGDGARERGVILASTKRWAHGKFAEDLTGLRHEIAVEGQRRGLVDIYGRDWGDVPTMGESRNPVGGWAAEKHRVLGDYAFNLCLENNHVPGFVTEKPWQAIRGGCLPVYYGSSWMDEIFPCRDYLDLRDFDSVEAVLDAMASMPDDERVERVRNLQAALLDLEAAHESATMRGHGKAWLMDILAFVAAIDDGVERQSTPWKVADMGARDYAREKRAGRPTPEPRPLPEVQRPQPRRRWRLSAPRRP